MGKLVVVNSETAGREESLKNLYRSAGILLAKHDKLNPDYIKKTGSFHSIIHNLHNISGIKNKLIILFEDHTHKINLDDEEFRAHMANILIFSLEGKKLTRQEVVKKDYFSVFMSSFLNESLKTS
uniref:Uncharacterized protein n=1 Tax=Anaerobacillus isosaccharinicus TaxID=1532552 RepID=A0A1S2M9E7_9BACI